MARADLLLDIVRAGSQGDKVMFRKTVEALAANERAKSHTILADRLIAQLQTSNGYSSNTVPISKASNAPLVIEKVPARQLSDLILIPHVGETVHELVAEQHRADLLRSYNLEPRNRVILTGPPGNGKTSLAEAIADELCVSLLVVSYEAVIGSYLGETARRIARVFEHARSQRCVLLFDEFDAVGKERGDAHETGEIKRVVSSILLQIDSLPSYVLVIAASNHPEVLDRAVWRRFQIRLELEPPKQQQIEKWFCTFEKRSGHSFGIDHKDLAKRLHGLSFAEVEDFSIDLLRKMVLDGPNSCPKKTLDHRLLQWKKRLAVRQ